MSTDDEQPLDPEATAPERPQFQIRRSPAFEAIAARQTELDAKFAKLRAVAGEATKSNSAKFADLFSEADRIKGLEVMPQIDIRNTPEFRSAAAAERTAEQLGVLVDAALGAEQRETTMLRWTKAGVVLAAIAALASVIAIVVTLAFG